MTPDEARRKARAYSMQMEPYYEARRKAVTYAVATGQTMRSVGADWGITGNRVTQLVRHHTYVRLRRGMRRVGDVLPDGRRWRDLSTRERAEMCVLVDAVLDGTVGRFRIR